MTALLIEMNFIFDQKRTTKQKLPYLCIFKTNK